MRWHFRKRLQKFFMVVGGLAMIGGAIWFLDHNRRFLRESERAPGTVTDIEAVRGSKGFTLYRAVVRYTPARAADPLTFKDKTKLWPSPFSPGDLVTVAYPAAHPEKARIDSFWTMWFLPALMAGFGVVCMLVGWFAKL